MDKSGIDLDLVPCPLVDDVHQDRSIVQGAWDNHGEEGHVPGCPLGWGKEEDVGGLEGDANVPVVEMGQRVGGLRGLCP